MSSQPCFTHLSTVSTDKGSIRHIIRFPDFRISEIYSSDIIAGEIKGWKYHKSMTCRIVPIHGRIKFTVFSIYDSEPISPLLFTIGLENNIYGCLTIPPNFWFSFQSLDDANASLLNIADFAHDDQEVVRAPLNRFPFI